MDAKPKKPIGGFRGGVKPTLPEGQRRKAITMRLAPETLAWLETREEGKTATIENGLRLVQGGNQWPSTHTSFALGDEVRKVRGSQWQGKVCGWYSTDLTPEGYAVESATETGSVQIYPAAALEKVAQG